MGIKRIDSVRRYSPKTLMKEREYGFYWYAWLWNALRPVSVLLCALVISLGMLATIGGAAYDRLWKPMDPGDSTTVSFEIKSGESITKIAANLAEQGLLRNKGVFKYLIMFEGLTNKVQYGTYQVSPSMNASQIISVLTSGSSSTERTITIIPGWTIEDIGEYLVRIGALANTNDFYALCNNETAFSNYYVVEEAASGNRLRGRRYVLEGYLAPDTYQVFANADAETLIKTLLNQTDVVIDEIFNASTAAEGAYVTTLSTDETLVLASLIEKEAGLESDYAKLSAVLHNRLAANMTLDCDSAVVYALGVDSTFLLTAEQLAFDSPYNTYRYAGLPAGPICNPSAAAIKAALYPDMNYIASQYLYFCSGDPETKQLVFNKTLEEHTAAVDAYRPLWEAYEQKAAEATPAP